MAFDVTYTLVMFPNDKFDRLPSLQLYFLFILIITRYVLFLYFFFLVGTKSGERGRRFW